MKNHGNTDVKVVKINYEKTVYLPQGFGSFFPKLEELYVMSSELHQITRKDFTGIEKLKAISFYHNEIEEIPEDTFFDLSELKMMSFFRNKIEKVPLLLLRNLHKLEEISFRSNLIEHISLHFFENNKNLKHVTLSHNKIVAFSAALVFQFPNLSTLSLASNSCINKNFNFGIDSKNSTYASILESCQAECQFDYDIVTECSDQLKECEESVENGWKENEKLRVL